MKKTSHILSAAAVLALGATSLVGCVSAGDGKTGVSVGSDGAVISAPGVTVSGGADGAKVEASDATVNAGSDGASIAASESTEGAADTTPEATESGAAGASATDGASAGAAGESGGPLPLHIGWEELVTEEVECTGGVATVETTGAIVKLLQPCERVVVDATGATVVLTQPVDTLEISGSGNTVAGAKLTSVEITGTGNTVAYAGTKPSVDDQGTGSVVSATPIQLPNAAG
ncbi:DUF3060 domain-containing protein [Galactobacter valiniphilus]|uniref:DUF3060 domain-containing protein n=1 Tax=Galactobacter valiniphilus TaxID=2676122 RepID=UPI00373663BE